MGIEPNCFIPCGHLFSQRDLAASLEGRIFGTWLPDVDLPTVRFIRYRFLYVYSFT